jgi:hypothetical protein
MDRELELLGFTEYEARVYRALLVEHPATAYRLGKLSGVPLSRVYEIASRLVDKGAASIAGEDPARYTPVPPDELVSGAHARLTDRLEGLKAELGQLYGPGAEDGYSWVRGQDNLAARAASTVASAKGDISAAGTPGAQAWLAQALKARRPGVRVRTLPLGHGSSDDASFVLLADLRSAMVGRLSPAPEALVTSHTLLVRLCDEYFRLRLVADAARQMIAANQPVRLPTAQRPTGWLDWEEAKQRRLLPTH